LLDITRGGFAGDLKISSDNAKFRDVQNSTARRSQQNLPAAVLVLFTPRRITRQGARSPFPLNEMLE
jgi:hypothetical protein